MFASSTAHKQSDLTPLMASFRMTTTVILLTPATEVFSSTLTTICTRSEGRLGAGAEGRFSNVYPD
jgi:hypothetical protein